jgi:hypothetical protein
MGSVSRSAPRSVTRSASESLFGSPKLSAYPTLDLPPKDTRGGMLFIVAMSDNETRAYIGHSPIFHHVRGYQDSTCFLSDDMIKRMVGELEEKDPEYKGIACGTTEEDINLFLYEYTSCMTECKGGEVPRATFLVRVYI